MIVMNDELNKKCDFLSEKCAKRYQNMWFVNKEFFLNSMSLDV